MEAGREGGAAATCRVRCADVPPARSQRDLLGLAWLCEQAARCCEWDGDPALSVRLRQDAARFRARAVDA